MIVEVFDEAQGGLLVSQVESDTPDVTELAAALANLPTDTLAALRDVLRSLNATA